jgi:hypothetical protein
MVRLLKCFWATRIIVRDNRDRLSRLDYRRSLEKPSADHSVGWRRAYCSIAGSDSVRPGNLKLRERLVRGALSTTAANQTIAATASFPITSSLSKAQASETISAVGGPISTASLSTTEAPNTFSATGRSVAGASLATAQLAQTVVATGADVVGATLAVVQGAQFSLSDWRANRRSHFVRDCSQSGHFGCRRLSGVRFTVVSASRQY